MVTLVERRRHSKRRPLTPNLTIYVAPMVRKVIRVQCVLKERKKVVQVEVDQQTWL